MPAEACNGLWRSEDMGLYQLHIQREAAHDCVSNLGQLGSVQFRDLNSQTSAFQRLFTNDLRRCDEAERRIRFFESEIARSGAIPNTHIPPGSETLDTLEPKLEQLETELQDLNARVQQLQTQKNSSLEYKMVLDKDASFYKDSTLDPSETNKKGILDEPRATSSSTDIQMPDFRMGGLRYLTGVINDDRYTMFERLVFRATRGNMYMKSGECTENLFKDPVTGKVISKRVFVVFFSAQRAYEKIKKLCESQSATLYPYNIDNMEEVREMQTKVDDALANLDKVLSHTDKMRTDLLQQICSDVYSWRVTVVTEKSIFTVLNMLSFKGQTVVAECWAPKDQSTAIIAQLTAAHQVAGASMQPLVEEIPNHPEPPTYFRTNKFTGTYQGIVESYGIGRYKEINPGVFTVITFPFLFGIMYGDVGHGVLLTLFAIFLILKEKQFSKSALNEIFAIIFGGRYLLILMGIFAIWVGLLYNDTFAMMIEYAGTSKYWLFPESEENRADCSPETFVWSGIDPSANRACAQRNGQVYVLGLDPSWQAAENKLEFVNGLKMKMAVILGVLQMLLGEVLQLMNHIFFQDWKHIFFGFVPEVVFLVCTFGYMDIMILIKWLTNWGREMGDNAHQPPSVLETMTQFFLSPGSVTKDKYLYVSPGFQNGIQVFLLVLALLCIPFLLIPIPLSAYFENKNRAATHEMIDEESTEVHDDHAHGEDHAAGGAHGHGGDMSEIVIKQVIHTIEFVLGAVSNTASYLRLWALSLAHAQLSEVFWEFGIVSPIEDNNPMFFFMWSGWAGATVGVLLMMEALSAFLHALRLHWVEFQGKFYAGDGVKFAPFSIVELTPEAHMYVHEVYTRNSLEVPEYFNE